CSLTYDPSWRFPSVLQLTLANPILSNSPETAASSSNYDWDIARSQAFLVGPVIGLENIRSKRGCEVLALEDHTAQVRERRQRDWLQVEWQVPVSSALVEDAFVLAACNAAAGADTNVRAALVAHGWSV
ncbi:hypothetical protein, partial [Verminephrobacter aporrectodeae]|uniref:hypothetical protein n=1 Tax=Verminephrobacter aporrectodeae TaxID=1110389 RepID=UPI0022449E0E